MYLFYQSDASQSDRRRRRAPERRSQRQMEREMKEEVDRIRKENQVTDPWSAKITVNHDLSKSRTDLRFLILQDPMI